MSIIASFPNSVWDGLTENREIPGDIKNPDDRDWDRMTVEIRAMQQHLNVLFSGSDDNHIELVEPVWDDLRLTASHVRVPAEQNPTWTAYKGAQVLAFADQSVEVNEEIIYYLTQLPHRYLPGSLIVPHVHWVGEDTGAQDVVWQLTYSWANHDDVFPAETTIVTPADTNSGNHQVTRFAPVDGTGMEWSSMIIGSLSRKSSAVEDTYAGKNAYLLELDFHYQVGQFGSHLESDY